MIDLDDHDHRLYQSMLEAPDVLPPLFPLPAAAPALLSLADEPCTFLLCWYGNGLALGFRGSSESVERCYNWCHSTGTARGALHHVYERSERGVSYVMVRSMDQLKAGLKAQFRAEAIMRREMTPLEDRYVEAPDTDDEADLGVDTGPVLTYDENRLDSRANQRAEDFLRDRIVYVNFLGAIPTSVATTYDVASVRSVDVGDD